MAKIRDQEKQRKALKNINNSIKDLESANEFLKAHTGSGLYTIAFTGDDGKKYSREIHLDSKDIFNTQIMRYKEQENQRIKALAEENGIDLDPKDIEIMDFTI